MSTTSSDKREIRLILEKDYIISAKRLLIKKNVSVGFFIDYILKELAIGNPILYKLLEEASEKKTELIFLKQDKRNNNEEALYNLIERHLKDI